MNKICQIVENLNLSPKRWLVTGVAGFIGSNILEFLLKNGQFVIGLDNFSTGFQSNLDDVKRIVGLNAWNKFEFHNGDINDLETCKAICKDVDYLLHQAALGSVPRSISDPLATNKANIDGFLNILVAAKEANVKKIVYAGSSSTYGDIKSLPKVENLIGNPLSPYAVTKLVNELYARVFSDIYNVNVIGLRYFNVFGKRQNQNGAYAAVIPKWINAVIDNQNITINGTGETSRDFTHVENVVQANLLAATSSSTLSGVYNVACSEQLSLNCLLSYIVEEFQCLGHVYTGCIEKADFRKGDVMHSLASIDKIRKDLEYQPIIKFRDGLKKTIQWYAP